MSWVSNLITLILVLSSSFVVWLTFTLTRVIPQQFMPRCKSNRGWKHFCALHLFFLVTLARSPPISIDGNHFFYLNGSQFFIRGVAYQDGGARAVRASVARPVIDPLSDGLKCLRDIPHLIKLGINVVRVYALNTSLDHSACMQSFDDAGIYVLADLGDGFEDILRSQKPTWTYALQERFSSLVDGFHEYHNLLGFIVASEVVTDRNRTAEMPFVKSAVRDVKNYIKMKGYRNIPVGYTGSEDAVVQKIPSYLICADIWNNPVIDFYGISLYGWCGESSLEASGYQRQIQNFKSYPIPVFISEYGCTKPSPRSFMEVAAIYGDKGMTDVFSGAIAYQYYNDSYGSGLVNVMGNAVEETQDFTALAFQLASNTPPSTSIGKWPSTSKASIPCPTLDNTWSAGAAWPPVPNKGICACMLQSLKCVHSSGASDQASFDALEVLCGDTELKSECAGISGNGTIDKYGSYSICSPAEQHSFVLNQLLISQMTEGKSPEQICSTLHGTTQTSEGNETGSDACQIVLRQAGPQGTGTITSTPSNLPTITPTRRSTFPASLNNSKSKLGTGAMAGVIAPIILGVLSAIGFGIWRFFRRKKTMTAPANDGFVGQASQEHDPKDQKSVSDLNTNVSTYKPNNCEELEANSVAVLELPENGVMVMAELAGDQEFIELPASPDDERTNSRYIKSE